MSKEEAVGWKCASCLFTRRDGLKDGECLHVGFPFVVP